MNQRTVMTYIKHFLWTWCSKYRRKFKSSFASTHPPHQTPLTLPPELEKIIQRYDGKLLLREEIELPETIFQSLLDQHYFIPVHAIQTRLFYSRCMRCHQRQRQLFGKIPCLRCEKTHVYCRNCLAMGRVLACASLYSWSGPSFDWPRHLAPCTWGGTLTDAQQFAADRIINTIQKQQKMLVWAVTGAGKSEMLFPGIAYALQQGMRVCIASPRADVIRELLPRLQNAFAGVSVQGLYSGSRDQNGTAQLILSTTHQLYRYEHAFDVLVIDEIDAFPFHQDDTLHYAAKRARKRDAATVYLTATPRQKQRLQMMWKKLAYVFVPSRFHGHPLIVPKSKYIPSLQQKLQKQIIPPTIQEWLRRRNFSVRQLLIFVPTIRLLENITIAMQAFLLQTGQLAAAYEINSAHAGDVHRKEKVHDFRAKKIKVLVTTTILERGVTFPSIDVLVLQADHIVFDEAALVQVAGRAGRSPRDPFGEVMLCHEGKTNAIVQAKQMISQMNRQSRKGGKI